MQIIEHSLASRTKQALALRPKGKRFHAFEPALAIGPRGSLAAIRPSSDH